MNKAKYKIEHHPNLSGRLKVYNVTHLFNGTKVKWYHEDKPIKVIFERFMNWLVCPENGLTSIGRMSMILGIILFIIMWSCAE